MSRQKKPANAHTATISGLCSIWFACAQSAPMAMAQQSASADTPIGYTGTPLPPDAPTRVNRFAQPPSSTTNPATPAQNSNSASTTDNNNLNPGETAKSGPNSRGEAATAPKVNDISKGASTSATSNKHAARTGTNNAHASSSTAAQASGTGRANVGTANGAAVAGSSSGQNGSAANAQTGGASSIKTGSSASAQTPDSKNRPGKNKSVSTAASPLLTPLTPKLAPMTPKAAPTQTTAAPTKPGQGSTTAGASPSDPTTTHSAAPAGASTASAPAPVPAPGGGIPGVDEYPTVGKLETITFGAPLPNQPIDQRLSKLEVAVLKTSFPQDSLFDRTERLKKILMGTQTEETASDVLPTGLPPVLDGLPMLQPEIMGTSAGMLSETFEDIANQPENQTDISKEQAALYALQLINEQRQKLALSPLAMDATASKIASEQAADLCERRAISHTNSKGDNPDRRFTVAGGNGALSESLVSVSRSDLGSGKHTRAAVARMLKSLVARQDDREALFAPEASDVGVAIDWTPEHDKLIGCIEIVTKHGTTEPIPDQVKVGEHVDVRGVVEPPFVFDKVTVAWEAAHAMGSTSDESEEALPYFPPLDYAAYQQKSEHDYSTAITVLKTAGIVAAIAGGVFMPPVALAAPLIAMSGTMGSADPKPASDIPVHSGMHVDSSGGYSGKIPINNAGKEGTYYVTVWASLGKGSKSVPVSRRAIVAAGTAEEVQGKLEKQEKHKAHKVKHKASETQDNE